jgi:hypothetical protein
VVLFVRWNDYQCLQLITAALLVLTGSCLHSGRNYEGTKEYSTLSRITHQAVENICSAVAAILETGPNRIKTKHNEGMDNLTRGLLVLWPLCCAFKTLKSSQLQYDWIRKTLWSVGAHAFIPQASALVRMDL